MISGRAARRRRNEAATVKRTGAPADSQRSDNGPSVTEVLCAARQSLDFARQGARDYEAGGDRRVSGIFNAATSGRTVTFVLQNLRGHVNGFDDWYEPVRGRLEESTVAQWAKLLRNRVEKRGSPGYVRDSLYIHHLNTDVLAGGAPPGTVSTVVGDEWGRNFWLVRLADGTEEKVYFALSPEIAVNKVVLEDSPDDRDVGDLLGEYIAILDEIVVSAEACFG